MHLLAMDARSNLLPSKKGKVDPPFKKETGLGVAWESIRFSSLFAAGDVSRGRENAKIFSP